ncbi:MAG: STAS domain-containing protein [Spirochaetota bacterium]|nr:STAS domain-containing protein [Spirochaetota bacterium]
MVFISLTEAIDGKVAIIELDGALDSETSHDLEEYIDQLTAKNQNLIIMDTSKLEYVSSVGIGVTLYVHKKILLNNGCFVICNLTNEISTLYKLLGFDKIFRIASNREEALQIMNKQLEMRDHPEMKNSMHEDNLELERLRVHSIEEVGFEENSLEMPSDEIAEKVAFDNPIILECAECKSLIRVKKSGAYMCPDCKMEFTVEADQTVLF